MTALTPAAAANGGGDPVVHQRFDFSGGAMPFHGNAMLSQEVPPRGGWQIKPLGQTFVFRLIGPQKYFKCWAPKKYCGGQIGTQDPKPGES